MAIIYPSNLSNCDFDVAKGIGHSIKKIADDVDRLVTPCRSGALYGLSADKEVSWR